MVPSADEHFYCATKYAVTALTEGLRQELREAKTHIRATVSANTLVCACVPCGRIAWGYDVCGVCVRARVCVY